MQMMEGESEYSLRNIEHQQLNKLIHLETFKDICKEMHKCRAITEKEFGAILDKHGLQLSTETMHELFSKMDFRGQGFMDVDDLAGYMEMCFRVSDPLLKEEKVLRPLQDYIIFKANAHKDPIKKIKFYYWTDDCRNVSKNSGYYYSVDARGRCHYWTHELKHFQETICPSETLTKTKTHILDAIYMPDISIFCVATLERQLRFYDRKDISHALRLTIQKLPTQINALCYWYPTSLYDKCKFFLGDDFGNIFFMQFCPENRGPFKPDSVNMKRYIVWDDLWKGVKVPEFSITKLNSPHKGRINLIEYHEHIDSLMVASDCGNGLISMSVLAMDISAKQSLFKIKFGTTIFAYNRKESLLATGGIDAIVRLWDPWYPAKSKANLTAHEFPVIYLFFQDNAKTLYTLDCRKNIIAWDVLKRVPLQRFNRLHDFFQTDIPLKAVYNDLTRQMLVGAMSIAIIDCAPVIDLELIDGMTHVQGVSLVLYNDLFKWVVTCGVESKIIVWDMCTGERLMTITPAHTTVSNGKILGVGITAATFDGSKHFFATGCFQGDIKVWDLRNCSCVRNFSLGDGIIVYSILWYTDRILASGSNKQVVEFTDTGKGQIMDSKIWNGIHLYNIVSTSRYRNLQIVTASDGGEIVIFDLHTGHPLRVFNANYPTKYLKVEYKQRLVYVYSRTQVRKHDLTDTFALNEEDDVTKHLPEIPLKILTILFLEKRPCTRYHATILVAISNGKVQIYSSNSMGGYMGEFNAAGSKDDFVTAMCTDSTNEFLFCSTFYGYIRVWYIVNYGVPESELKPIYQPHFRLEFPYLIKSTWKKALNRVLHNRPEPVLLTAHRAHLRKITRIAYAEKPRLTITSSLDKTVRLWTRSGQYIGTFGSPNVWKYVSGNRQFHHGQLLRRPPDVTRVASHTTLKVLEQQGMLFNENDESAPEAHINLGFELPPQPLLGKNYKDPDHVEETKLFTFDSEYKSINPVYQHIEIKEIKNPVVPQLPQALIRYRNWDRSPDEYIKFLKTKYDEPEDN